jgi:hypothetical protein
MRAFLVFLCVIFAGALSPAAEAVCSVPQPRLVSAEYFGSELVVDATLVKTDEIHDQDDPDYALAYIYTLKVNRIFRGKKTATIRIREENDSSRATFDWVAGDKYLLFLFHVSEEKDWELDGCGNSGSLTEARETLSRVLQLRTAHGDGMIYGMVGEEAYTNGIAGVRVEASGSAGHFETVTGRSGRFGLKVPPGHYVVRATQKDIAFEMFFLSYSDPDDVTIEPGGCVQIQFSRVRASQ